MTKCYHCPNVATTTSGHRGWSGSRRVPSCASCASFWKWVRRQENVIVRGTKAAVLVAAAALALTGCATGRLIGTLPTVPDATQAATVVVARPFNVVGMARRPTILVDGQETYDLGPGEHVMIPVAPGERLIAMYIWDLLNSVRASVKIQAVAGKAYYFVMAPGSNLVEVTEADGREHVANTTAVEGSAH